MSALSPKLRRTLVKFFASSLLLIALILGCFSDIDPGLVSIMGGVLVVLVFPTTILLGIDASRIIKAEKPTNKKIKLLGIFLAVPQAVMGIILVAFGVVYPFIGIHEIIANRAVGRSGVFPFLMTVTAIAFLVVGAYYLREGLGFSDRND